MPIPRLVRTSKEEKGTVIRNVGASKLCWIIGVKMKVMRSGMPEFAWKAGNYPPGWMPWVPVSGPNEKLDPLLRLMMDFFIDSGSRYEFEPFLLYRSWLKEIEEDIRTYEWPYYPDDAVCPHCGCVIQYRPSELAPVRCETCDGLFLRETEDERGAVEEV